MQTEHRDNDQEHQAAFSRTGTASPVDALDDPLKTWVDPDTGAAFRKLVRECGYKETGASGAIRDWVYLMVHGKTFTDMKLESDKVKREALFGKGPIQALTVRGEVRS